MIHGTSTLSFAFDEAVTEIAFQGLIDTDLFMPALCAIKNMTGPTDDVASMGELSHWDEKPEGAEASTDRIIQQFTKRFVATPFAKIVDFSKEMIDWDRWGLVEDIAEQIGITAFWTIDNQLAQMFNSITSTQFFSGEDGLALATNAYTNVDAGNSQDNLRGNSLNHAGLKANRIAFRDLKGYETQTHLTAVGDELIYGFDLEEDAWAILNTALKPATTENTANMFRGRYTGFAWSRLTSDTEWGMMDSRLRRRNLRFYNSHSMEIETDGSFRRKVKAVGGYMRYALGFIDRRFIQWNQP